MLAQGVMGASDVAGNLPIPEKDGAEAVPFRCANE